jgi:hypothetical protein
MLLLLQAPGDGWAIAQTQPREVKRLYWDLFQTTEVFVRLIPENPEGKPGLVNLIFQAFFPGRAERDPYSGLPKEPKGKPARIAVTAQPLPLTAIRELSLEFVVDGKTIELTGPGHKYRNLPCLVATTDCIPNAVEAELELPILQLLITGKDVEGEALGFPIKLTEADIQALTEFVTRVGLRGKGKLNRPAD